MTTELVPNVPLLEKVYDHVVAHPEEWNQRFWRTEVPDCQTAYCFAGWTVELTGYEWVDGNRVLNTDGVSSHVSVVAAQELGLPQGVADALFWSHNDLPRIRRLLDRIVAGKLS